MDNIKKVITWESTSAKFAFVPRKFVANNISPVEEAYLQSISDVAKLAKKISRGKNNKYGYWKNNS